MYPMHSKAQQLYLNECLAQASKSPMTFKLGAVLVKGGKVVGKGYNHTNSRYSSDSKPRLRGFSTAGSFHAEMHAISAATGGRTPSFTTQAAMTKSCFRLGVNSLNDFIPSIIFRTFSISLLPGVRVQLLP
ncbi:hypothetical protein DL96DRAFT_1609822 [Flagelloscypha sp. PMI_526]|nr:hypothetical protein DL96DRAFT_1609822 [Flagelloscypha sp. PMI_526]